ncbi:MAG: hypothetical protein H0Z35_13875 [Thermoanaerobacteraceae bacterium]|nr:hypothetical protein [Thermoanaerobacteraceae bacterium]
MRKVILGSIAILLIIVLGLSWEGYKSNTKSVFDQDIPDNITFKDVNNSSYFKIIPRIIIKNAEGEKIPFLLFDILIKNKTNKPIYDIRATAFLNKKITPYMTSPLAVFGNTDDTRVDFVPGKIPYGLSISRTTQIPNYYKFSPKQRKEFFQALKLPIRLKIKFNSGEEYLQINSEDIEIQNMLETN